MKCQNSVSWEKIRKKKLKCRLLKSLPRMLSITTTKMHLSGLETNCRISTFFYKGDNFCDFLFAFLHTKLRVYSNRKEFTACGSKFFLFRVDPFPEGRQ